MSRRPKSPSRHVRDAIERRQGRAKPTPAQRRFLQQLEQQGFAVLAVGEGKVAGRAGTETVHRALVMRRAQPGVAVWAYANGKWVAVVQRFGQTTMLEGDSFEEVEAWYYRQVEAPRPQSGPAFTVGEEEAAAAEEQRGFTYRDRRRVHA